MRRLAAAVLTTTAILAVSLLTQLTARAQTEGAAPASPELTATLEQRDAELFAAFFDRCDVAAVRAMVTDDMEFFHDKGGLVTASGDAFAEDLRGHCERVKTGVDFAARRELVPGSVRVYVLNNYGAMTMGEHRFYRLTPGKPDEMTETGKFIIVWKNDGGVWKLARVVSYDHHLARPGS
ncbi:MAG: nuclear transport factor 2 family protein [Caulobacteraceae bacterium]|nr:nuclear transport factor 2 family protein [Caulobacteraceae bacterium]